MIQLSNNIECLCKLWHLISADHCALRKYLNYSKLYVPCVIMYLHLEKLGVIQLK